MIEYTQEQKEAISAGLTAFKIGTPLFRIAGAAGTGKSTILKAIVNDLPNIAICAYTGKAASVLRSKGMDGTTIHSRVYKWNEELSEFLKVDHVDYNGFAIDEGSMVGNEIFRDIESYGKPILVIGDNNQLEPISSRDINLMSEPDIILQQIHRQAEGNPIIDLATRIRKQEPWGYQDADDRALVLKSSAFWEEIDWADVILCGYNRTRVAINKRIRHKRRYSRTLEVGEKIICLQNDRKLGIFNGLSFEVLKIVNESTGFIRADIRSDDGITRSSMPIWTGCFHKEKIPDWKLLKKFQGKSMVADYGYGMTVHKSQGSEWPRVAIKDEQCDLWSAARHRYTGITRASANVRVYGDFI